jgi:hypothetical protein
MTVRTRSTGNAPKEVLWSLVKQTTSHRPIAGRWGQSGSPSTSAGTSVTTSCAKDGKRFSNTTTS